MYDWMLPVEIENENKQCVGQADRERTEHLLDNLTESDRSVNGRAWRNDNARAQAWGTRAFQ